MDSSVNAVGSTINLDKQLADYKKTSQKIVWTASGICITSLVLLALFGFSLTMFGGNIPISAIRNIVCIVSITVGSIIFMTLIVTAPLFVYRNKQQKELSQELTYWQEFELETTNEPHVP